MRPRRRRRRRLAGTLGPPGLHVLIAVGLGVAVMEPPLLLLPPAQSEADCWRFPNGSKWNCFGRERSKVFQIFLLGQPGAGSES